MDILFIFVIGSIFGSFFGLIVDRIPLRKSIIFGFSSRLKYTNYKFRTTEQSTIRKYCQLSKGAKKCQFTRFKPLWKTGKPIH